MAGLGPSLGEIICRCSYAFSYPTVNCSEQRDFTSHRFPTDYAGTNEGEFFAEEFSIHFGDKAKVIEQRDTDAASLMQEALNQAGFIAGR